MKKLALALILPVAACTQATVPAVPQAGPKLDLSKPDARCGDILYFDFGSIVDAPAYYVHADGTVISRCGGLLRGNTGTPQACPPQGWTCPMPDVSAIYEKHRQTNR